MQSCEVYLEQISRMMDGELPETERAELLAHLEQCEYCRNAYAAFAAVSSQLAEPDFPSIDLSAEIMAQIRQEPLPKAKQQSRRFSPLRMTALVAGLALVLFAVSRLPFWTNPSVSDAAVSNEATTESSSSMADSAEQARDAGTKDEADMPASMDSAKANTEQSSSLTPADRLYNTLDGLLPYAAQPSDRDWLEAMLQLCNVCDITDGGTSMQEDPDYHYSLSLSAQGKSCSMLFWQTERIWTIFIKVNNRHFTLQGDRTELEYTVPSAYAWIAEHLSE